jgi:chorismate synthase
MPANTFGELFRITTWGESHGGGVGVVIDGCPPKLEISEAEIQVELDRRKPGQSKLTTTRGESDIVQILSGVFEGKTTGTPISMLIWNKDAKSGDYAEMQHTFRPSHADFTYQEKFGIRNWQGGGRASARETIGRVAAGAIAKKLLLERGFTEVLAFVTSVHAIDANIDFSQITQKDIESSIIRCPDKDATKRMEQAILDAKASGDSLGGIITCIVSNVPKGLGAPVFDKLEADLAKAMLSIPATKGFEVGSGFAGTRLFGSEHNDSFCKGSDGKTHTTTNNSGGIQGGISNGEDIVLRIAFKPTATISKEQNTVDDKGKETTLAAKGRHDPCVLPRAVPIVEAMVALVLVDHLLRQKAQCE